MNKIAAIAQLRAHRVFARVPSLVMNLVPGVIWRRAGPAAGAAIYFTFDDGPHARHTPALLEVLQQFQAAATFFVLGECASRHPQVIRQIACGGHTIGNHGWTHRKLSRFNSAMTAREIVATQTVLRRQRVNARLFRPPYGRLGPASRRAARELGYQVVMWSFSPADYLSTWDAAALAAFLEEHLRPGDIVLLHDGLAHSNITVSALAKFFEGRCHRRREYRSLPA